MGKEMLFFKPGAQGALKISGEEYATEKSPRASLTWHKGEGPA